jgi:hypothetical protein
LADVGVRGNTLFLGKGTLFGGDVGDLVAFGDQ